MIDTPLSPAPAGEHHEHQPLLYTPYDEPDRHWKLHHYQTTGEVLAGPRPARWSPPMGAFCDEQLRPLASAAAGFVGSIATMTDPL